MEKTPAGAAGLAKHSTIYAIGTLSRQLVGFLLLPVYTHYLSPADYGVVGLLVFSLALLEPLLGARLGEAIPKFYFEQEDERARGTVISTALMITGGISLVIALLIFATRDLGSQMLFGNDRFGIAVGIFGIQILTQAIEYYGLTFIRIQQRPLLYITISLSKLVVQLLMNVWLIVFLELGIMGVVISGSVCSAVYAIGLTIYTLRRTGCRYDAFLARRMLRFNMPLWFAGLAALYIFSANRYYLRLFSSLDQVGLYELATRLAGVLPLLIWEPFAKFWEMERFNYYRLERSGRVFQSVFRFVSALLVVAALGIAIFAEPVIRIMSAQQFHDAAYAVPFLAVAMIFSCLANFSSFSFLVTENTGAIRRNSIITAVAITGLNLALIPHLGQVGAAIALMLALAAQFFLIHWEGKRYFDMQIQLRPLLLMLVICVAAYLAAEALARDASLWLSILMRAAVYAACLVLVGILLWRDATVQVHLRKMALPILNRLRKPA